MSGRNLGLSALVAVFLGFGSPLASAQKFHLEEATIADIHRAIKARQINATQLVSLYLKRIEAYNGTCVKGAVDPQPVICSETSSRSRRRASSAR